MRSGCLKIDDTLTRHESADRAKRLESLGVYAHGLQTRKTLTFTKEDIVDTKIKSFEFTEAAGLTTLREKAVQIFSTRTGKALNTPILLRLGHLSKSTTTHKTSKGVEQDVVNKPSEINKTTKDGKPLTVITLNQRLMLTMSRKPLDHTSAVVRLMGAIMDALTDIAIPREANAKGTLHRTAEGNKALKRSGWANWREPLDHGVTFATAIAPKVVFAADAFELPKPDKKDNGRKVFKVEIKDEDGKLLVSLVCPKTFAEGNRAKADKLRISIIEADADALAKADKLTKALSKDEKAKMDEAAKLAEAAEMDKLIKSLESDEPTE